MSKEKKSGFKPNAGTIASIFVILCGVAIVILLDEFTFKLIGGFIALLGIIAFFMQFAQTRDEGEKPLSDIERKYRKKTEQNEIPLDEEDSFVIKGKSKSKENTPAPEPQKSEEKSMNDQAISDKSEENKAANEEGDFIDGDEGFKIIKKPAEMKFKPDDSSQSVYDKYRSSKAKESAENEELREESPADKSVNEKPPPESEPSTAEKKVAAATLEVEDSSEEEPAQAPAVQGVPDPEYPDEDYSFDFNRENFELPVEISCDEANSAATENDFEQFVSKSLNCLRLTVGAKTATFFLVNIDTNELILESYLTPKPDSINKNMKKPISGDLVSQIAEKMEPEFFEINESAELDLLPYYSTPEKTRSFAGAPIFVNETVVGAICVDSEIENRFNKKTLAAIENIAGSTGVFLRVYSENFDLQQNSRTLEAIKTFRNLSADREMSLPDAYKSIVEAVGKLFDFKTVGVCGYDDSLGGWKIQYIISSKENERTLVDKSVDLENSLVGRSIMEGSVVFERNLTEDATRVHPDEQKYESAYFAAAPVVSTASSYGALFIEGESDEEISEHDVAALATLGEHSGLSVEMIHFIEMLQSCALFDEASGIYNPPAFYHRLGEEVVRNVDFNFSLTLCLFKIDKYASFDPQQYKERQERVLYHVLQVIRKLLRPYDIFGRADSSTFGVALVGMKLNQAKIWAERLRQEIAISALEINSRRFTVTVSIGVADAENVDSVENLTANARKALNISLDKTNSVTAFS